MVFGATHPREITIPDTFTLLSGNCPHCGGNVYAERGSIACLMCARGLYIKQISETGRVLEFAIHWVEPQLSRLGRSEGRRNQRSIARDQGLTGRAARALSHIPAGPQLVGVSKVAKRLAVRNAEAQEALDTLVAQGLIVSVVYGDGHQYVGYHLARRPREDG